MNISHTSQAAKNKIKLKSYSKINLALWIKNKRKDGFHEIESIFYEYKGLYDDLEIIFVPGDVLKIEVSFLQNKLNEAIMEKDNLAYKAVKAYLNKIGVNGTCKVKINKKIPMMAGLGGGSSNAAFVLIGLNKLFDYQLHESELLLLAKEIGSDVPFFILGGICLVSGKGEILKKLDSKLNFNIQVIKPADVSISTKWAYDEFDLFGKKFDRDKRMKALLNALQASNHELFFSNMFNDFEDVVFNKYPQILDLRNKLLSEGFKKVMLCGSGSAVFGIKEA
ncbi:MAG: 4-(cytidine 5'-diphospho)-2-C-methyl-D-erythritol kinase [Candidatus Melainabacteria bacterium]|nr:4-(cytidine 5'-diphospho)-2-C-methyl-D-erythritol kinase [Candidatus Melainabacteria bacterium]